MSALGRNVRFRRHQLSVAVACACLAWGGSTAQAQGPSEIWTFGDSLLDAGFYSAGLGGQGYATTPAGDGLGLPLPIPDNESNRNVFVANEKMQDFDFLPNNGTVAQPAESDQAFNTIFQLANNLGLDKSNALPVYTVEGALLGPGIKALSNSTEDPQQAALLRTIGDWLSEPMRGRNFAIGGGLTIDHLSQVRMLRTDDATRQQIITTNGGETSALALPSQISIDEETGLLWQETGDGDYVINDPVLEGNQTLGEETSLRASMTGEDCFFAKPGSEYSDGCYYGATHPESMVFEVTKYNLSDDEKAQIADPDNPTEAELQSIFSQRTQAAGDFGQNLGTTLRTGLALLGAKDLLETQGIQESTSDSIDQLAGGIQSVRAGLEARAAWEEKYPDGCPSGLPGISCEAEQAAWKTQIGLGIAAAASGKSGLEAAKNPGSDKYDPVFDEVSDVLFGAIGDLPDINNLITFINSPSSDLSLFSRAIGLRLGSLLTPADWTYQDWSDVQGKSFFGPFSSRALIVIDGGGNDVDSGFINYDLVSTLQLPADGTSTADMHENGEEEEEGRYVGVFTESTQSISNPFFSEALGMTLTTIDNASALGIAQELLDAAGGVEPADAHEPTHTVEVQGLIDGEDVGIKSDDNPDGESWKDFVNRVQFTEGGMGYELAKAQAGVGGRFISLAYETLDELGASTILGFNVPNLANTPNHSYMAELRRFNGDPKQSSERRALAGRNSNLINEAFLDAANNSKANVLFLPFDDYLTLLSSDAGDGQNVATSWFGFASAEELGMSRYESVPVLERDETTGKYFQPKDENGNPITKSILNPEEGTEEYELLEEQGLIIDEMNFILYQGYSTIGTSVPNPVFGAFKVSEHFDQWDGSQFTPTEVLAVGDTPVAGVVTVTGSGDVSASDAHETSFLVDAAGNPYKFQTTEELKGVLLGANGSAQRVTSQSEEGSAQWFVKSMDDDSGDNGTEPATTTGGMFELLNTDPSNQVQATVMVANTPTANEDGSYNYPVVDENGEPTGDSVTLDTENLEDLKVTLDNDEVYVAGDTTNQSNLAAVNADNTFDPQALVFNDGLHPTQQGYGVYVDMLSAVVVATDEFALLPQTGLQAARQHMDDVQEYMDAHRWAFDQGEGEFALILDYAKGKQKFDATPTTAEGDTDLNAITIGAAYRFDNLQIGLTGNFANNDLEMDDTDSEYDLDSWGVAAFANWRTRGLFADLFVGYTDLDYDNKRKMELGRLAKKTTKYNAKSDPGGDVWSGALRVGYDIFRGQKEKIRFGPQLGFAYHNGEVDDFEENGKDSTDMLHLKVESQDIEAFNYEGGAFIDYSMDYNVKVFAEGVYGWQKSDSPDDVVVTPMGSSTTTSYSRGGYEPDDNYARFNVGLAFEITRNLTARASMLQRRSSDDVETSGDIGLSWRF